MDVFADADTDADEDTDVDRSISYIIHNELICGHAACCAHMLWVMQTQPTCPILYEHVCGHIKKRRQTPFVYLEVVV